MSEREKLAHIQEKLKEAENHQRYGTACGSIGAVVAVFGFALTSLSQPVLYVGIIGLLLVVFGMFFSAYYALQRTKLMEQLRQNDQTQSKTSEQAVESA